MLLFVYIGMACVGMISCRIIRFAVYLVPSIFRLEARSSLYVLVIVLVNVNLLLLE